MTMLLESNVQLTHMAACQLLLKDLSRFVPIQLLMETGHTRSSDSAVM